MPRDEYAYCPNCKTIVKLKVVKENGDVSLRCSKCDVELLRIENKIRKQRCVKCGYLIPVTPLNYVQVYQENLGMYLARLRCPKCGTIQEG